MPRILTVDDSRAVRTILRKQITEMGFEAWEAEDGEQGLTKLQEGAVDLVLLDVTMPVLDGPGMLARMREGGNKTPVIMLTSESKRTIVAGVMKLGIDDYILKPFKPEELKAKMMTILGAANDSIVDTRGAAQAPAPAAIVAAVEADAPVAATRQFVDVMLIDDMENVCRKLRSLLPLHMSMVSFASAESALAACREKAARVIMIDNELPDVVAKVLTRQIRLLQPQAALLTLALRTTNDLAQESKDNGFDDVMYKPFGQYSIDDFLVKYFDNQDVLVCADGVFKVGAFRGNNEARLPLYFDRLSGLFVEAIKKTASACFDKVILDLTSAPTRQDTLPRVILSFVEQAKTHGIELKIVGTPEMKKILGAFTETRALPFFATAQDAL